MKPFEKKEIEFEVAAADYAQALGGLLKKCVVPGERDWPDRIGLFPNAHTFYIEFKRPKEEPRRGQLANHKMLRRLGYSVYVCKSLDEAKQIIDKEMEIAHVKSTKVHSSRLSENSN